MVSEIIENTADARDYSVGEAIDSFTDRAPPVITEG
jgi:hypothetical protein